MKILLSFRAIPGSPGWSTGECLARGFESLGHDVHHYAKVYNENRWLEDPKELITQSWDLFIWLECGDGDRVYWELGCLDAKKKISWGFDIALYPQQWQEIITSIGFDYNFLANPDLLSTFNNSVYLPYAADDKLHYRPLSFPKQYDFALIGSDRPGRRILIDQLKTEGLNARLITNIYREQYINALAYAKIVINDEAGGGHNLLAMRWAEAQMAGSRVLTPLGPLDQNLKTGLTNSKMSCDYNCVEDIVVYAKNWLDKTPSQEDHDDFIKNHSYINRAQKILEICGL